MNKNRKFTRRAKRHDHQWVTVINPMNNRLLLQACDNCGVVQSENSMMRNCRQPRHQHLISELKSTHLLLSA